MVWSSKEEAPPCGRAMLRRRQREVKTGVAKEHSAHDAVGLGYLFDEVRVPDQIEVDVDRTFPLVDLLECTIGKACALSQSVEEFSQEPIEFLIVEGIEVTSESLPKLQKNLPVKITHSIDMKVAPAELATFVNVDFQVNSCVVFVEAGVRDGSEVEVSLRAVESAKILQTVDNLRTAKNFTMPYGKEISQPLLRECGHVNDVQVPKSVLLALFQNP